MKISFTVRGNPKAQKRHRHTRTGVTYDPSSREKQDFLLTVQNSAPAIPLNDPLKVKAAFYFPIPKSVPKYLRKQMLEDTYPHTKTPDADNCLKFLFDSLNKIFYTDDKLIYSIMVEKFYSETPRTEVTIEDSKV